MGSARDPRRLSDALSELIALRGLARVRGDAQLATIWKEVAGRRIAADTRVLGVRRGILRIAVTNAPLLSELVGFHRFSLLDALKQRFPELKVSGLKFVLRGEATR
jgi:hypothetical protein